MKTNIAKYPGREMTVHYGDSPNRSNLFHVKTMNNGVVKRALEVI